MKQLFILVFLCNFLVGCGLYATTQYTVQTDAQQSMFDDSRPLKKGSSCSFLLLGVVPWPWHKHKTPDTLLEAIQQAGIKKLVWIDSTYDYKFTYANMCRNAYGY